MPTAKEDDVRRIIGPDREAKLCRAFDKAWEDVGADISKYALWPRTRANMVFERLAVRLQQEFADDVRAAFCFHDETVKIVLDDTVLLRCKKANGQGFGQNIPTQANLAFCEGQIELPGLEGFQKIEIVYGVNQFGTEMDGIVVQARDGEMRLWAYPIPSSAAGAGAGTVVPLPLSPAPPPPSGPTPDVSDLVQPRKTPAAAEETDKSEK
jgi:hypothetical protein